MQYGSFKCCVFSKSNLSPSAFFCRSVGEMLLIFDVLSHSSQFQIERHANRQFSKLFMLIFLRHIHLNDEPSAFIGGMLIYLHTYISWYVVVRKYRIGIDVHLSNYPALFQCHVHQVLLREVVRCSSGSLFSNMVSMVVWLISNAGIFKSIWMTGVDNTYLQGSTE